MTQKKLNNLVEDYHRYSKAYYEDKELISDVEFDKLEREILSYKEEYPNIVRRIEVVGSITNGLPFKHKVRMYSLDKVHSLDCDVFLSRELSAWGFGTWKNRKTFCSSSQVCYTYCR